MPTRKDEEFVKPNPRIPAKTIERLRRVAEIERRSINDMINIAIEELCDRRERQNGGGS